MLDLFKYMKYVPLIVYLIGLILFGIPLAFYDIEVVIIVEYHLLFGSFYFLTILEEFFNISKKCGMLVRLVNIIIIIILLSTSILYKNTFSIIFPTIFLVMFSLELYLNSKKISQKDFLLKLIKFKES